MKKLSLLMITIALLTLTGCTLKTNEGGIINDEQGNTMPYSGELTI